MQPNPDGTLSDPLRKAIGVLQAESNAHVSSNMARAQTANLDTNQMEKLLIQGNRKEAVSLAEDAGHWGVAMLIARSMGESHWGDVVSRLASQFDPDSPLASFVQV